MTQRPEEPLWKFQQEKGDYQSCQTVTLENPKCFIPRSCTLLVMPLRGPQEHIKQAEFMITRYSQLNISACVRNWGLT